MKTDKMLHILKSCGWSFYISLLLIAGDARRGNIFCHSLWQPVTRVSRLLWWRWSHLPPYPNFSRQAHRWAQRKGKGLAAGVLAVLSGIHYLAHLKIHQRLPPFQHMVHLNFTASCSQLLIQIWGAAWSTVHQGNACPHDSHRKCHTCTK